MGARRIDAFAREILVGRTLGRIEQVRDLIGQHAVDLFRHRTVEAPQSRFDVRHRDSLFHRNQGAGQRRVDVADDDDAGWPVGVEHRLEATHYFGGLHSVGARTDLQVDVRPRQAKAREQLVVHVGVVVLTRMHE